MDTLMDWYIILLITGLLLFLLIRLILKIYQHLKDRNLNNKIKRMRSFPDFPDFMEKAENFIKDIPEEMVEIRFLTYSFFGIEYKNKMVFKCKICGQGLHPQPGSDGRVVRDSWQCPNGCKPGKNNLKKG